MQNLNKSRRNYFSFSIYEWEGQINEDNECLLIIKTQTSKVSELSELVKKNHPYEVCEVISTQIDNGNQKYLQWIGEVCSKSEK